MRNMNRSTNRPKLRMKGVSREKKNGMVMVCCERIFHSLLLLSAICSGLVAYYMYHTIPDGVEDQLVVRTWLGARKFIQHVALIGEKLGYGDRVVISRKGYTILERLKARYEPDETRIKTRNTIFADIRVRMYEPTSKQSKSPAIVYFHGGGWTSGSIESVEKFCRELAIRSNMVVVSVRYSLSPEQKYPQALDDCANATRYFIDTAHRYGVDSKRVALAGDDTGATLAAGLTIRSRDHAWRQKPQLHILIYPLLQVFDFNTPSYVQNRAVLTTLNNPLQIAKNVLFYINEDPNSASSLLVNNHTSSLHKEQYGKLVSHELIADNLRQGYQHPDYKTHDAALAERLSSYVLHPHFAPLMYSKLNNLARAYVVTMEHDSLRDDGMMYTRRLIQSGGKAVLKHYSNGYHDCITLLGYATLPELVLNDLVEFLKKTL